MLGELFGKYDFYYIARFSILASGPHLDATITSECFLPLLLLYEYFSCFR